MDNILKQIDTTINLPKLWTETKCSYLIGLKELPMSLWQNILFDYACSRLGVDDRKILFINSLMNLGLDKIIHV